MTRKKKNLHYWTITGVLVGNKVGAVCEKCGKRISIKQDGFVEEELIRRRESTACLPRA